MVTLKSEKTVTQRVVLTNYQSSIQGKELQFAIESIDKDTEESLGLSKPIRVEIKRTSADKFSLKILKNREITEPRELTLKDFTQINDSPEAVNDFINKYLLSS